MRLIILFVSNLRFQRFRATEECNADFCSFAGQRTTHFHCIRDSCNYTFKNKAEMGKSSRLIPIYLNLFSHHFKLH